MKSLSIFAIFCCLSFDSFGQSATTTESSDSTNLYFQALNSYIKYLVKSGSAERKLLVEKNNLTTDKLPSRFGQFEIIYLDGIEVRDQLKGKSEMKVIRIVPLRVKDSNFFINIIPFTVRMNKKVVNYINSGGEKVVFKYDSQSGKFYFQEIIHGNI